MKIKLKKKKNKYAQVHINLLRDRNLSLKAKGLGAILESYSDDFNLTVKSIELNSSDGVKAVKTAIKELESGFYLYRFQTHDLDGKFITYWAFDSQKLDINYLQEMINELEKVELITPINLNSPGYRNGTTVSSFTGVPFSASGFSTDGKCTTYNNTTYKNKRDKNTLSKNKRESFDFKKFKNYVSSFSFNFNLAGKLDYSVEHKGFEIRNGYIYSMHTESLVDSNEAFKIWDYLYQNKSKIYKIIDENTKEEIKNASPQPLKIGKTNVWKESEIVKYVEKLK